jgi:hypothetical protein
VITDRNNTDHAADLVQHEALALNLKANEVHAIDGERSRALMHRNAHA